MPNSEIQKKAIYFLVFAGVLSVTLALLPSLEEIVRVTLNTRFGIVADKEWALSMANGGEPHKMVETLISLASNLLLIFKIVIGMALVIATVRFVLFLFSRTVYRNTTQGEASSIIKTVLSIIIYIVAFFILFQMQYPKVPLAPLFTGSTILGIVVGLALQDTLGNLFAGLALQADQPFQVGDVVIISGRGEGVVESVSWRGVSIRTFRNTLL
ncbi:MAG: mechanosensitive ion channel domain-containing protein, partial [Pyrinomonadaceae bacterium]